MSKKVNVVVCGSNDHFEEYKKDIISAFPIDIEVNVTNGLYENSPLNIEVEDISYLHLDREYFFIIIESLYRIIIESLYRGKEYKLVISYNANIMKVTRDSISVIKKSRRD